MIPPSCLSTDSNLNVTLWFLDVRLLEVPFVVKFDLFPVDIGHSPSKTVQNGSTSTQIPLKISCEEFAFAFFGLEYFGLDVNGIGGILSPS